MEEMWGRVQKDAFQIGDADAAGPQTSRCPGQTFLYPGPPRECGLLLGIFYPRACEVSSKRTQGIAPPCSPNERRRRVTGRVSVVSVRVGQPKELGQGVVVLKIG